MNDFERLAAGYFVLMAVVSPFAPARGYRKATAIVTAAGLVGFVAVAAAYAGDAVRVWLPMLYLVAGYWLPALLVAEEQVSGRAAMSTFERWLRRTDLPLRARLPAVPAPLVSSVELAYLFCYPLVPAACAVVQRLGTSQDIQRFWIAVEGAGFACYATLPWLVSQPPRAGRDEVAVQRTRAANVAVLKSVSHQLNTFPSGHVAVSLAAAAAVAWVSPAIGAVFAAMAAAIAIGAAAGRYHYVIDVILGVVVAVVVVTAAT
jgi:hypothetical protein